MTTPGRIYKTKNENTPINTLSKKIRVFLLFNTKPMKKAFLLSHCFVVFLLNTLFAQKENQSWENPFLKPTERLKSYFTPKVFKINTEYFNLDSFYTWFPRIIDTMQKNISNPEYIYPSLPDFNNPGFQEYYILSQNLNKKPFKENTKKDFLLIQKKIQQISNPVCKTWAILNNGKQFWMYNRKNVEYFFLCDSFAREAKKVIINLEEGMPLKHCYEYLGDYYNQFLIYDSAVYYYTKSQEQCENFSTENNCHELSISIANIYSVLNFQNDFFYSGYHIAYAVESAKYYENPSEYNRLLTYKYYADYYREINQAGFSNSTIHERYAEIILKWISSESFSYQKLVDMYNIAAEIFFQKKDYETAIRVLRRKLLLTTFLTEVKINFQTLKHTLTFLEYCYINSKNIKEGEKIIQLLDNLLAKSTEYEKLLQIKNKASLHLYFNDIEKVDILQNKIWKNNYDTLFAPPYLSNIWQQWNILSRDYFIAKFKNSKPASTGLADSIIFYYRETENDISKLKNVQLSTIMAENVAAKQWLLNAIVESEREKETVLESERKLAVEVENVKRAKKIAVIERLKADSAKDEAVKQKEIANDSAISAMKQRDIADSLKSISEIAIGKINILVKQKDSIINWLIFFILLSVVLLVSLIYLFIVKLKTNKMKLEAKAALASLNPHFIKGIVSRFPVHVNNLTGEKLEDFAENIKSLVTKSFTLSEVDTGGVSIKEELEVINKLVKYYNETDHFANNVVLKIDKSDSADLMIRENKVPPLLLFNTVENALTKAFDSNSKKEKIINIRFEYINNIPSISIEDNGKGFDESKVEKSGILKNETLIKYYNSLSKKRNKLKFILVTKPGNGTKVIYQYV